MLGPVIFVCYINDLPDTISSFITCMRMIAKIFRQVNLDADGKGLQDDLQKLCARAVEWQLHFNVGKCKVMHMGTENARADMSMVDGTRHTLREKTSLEKDLGIWFSNTMKPADHVTHAVYKANQILGLIRRSFVYLDQQLMKQLFTALEYGNVIWHPHLQREIDLTELVQHRATRMVPGFHEISYEQRL